MGRGNPGSDRGSLGPSQTPMSTSAQRQTQREENRAPIGEALGEGFSLSRKDQTPRLPALR